MGQAHAGAFERVRMLYPDLPAKPRLHLLADDGDQLAEAARQRLGFAEATGDWRRLVKDAEVDLVDITSPNHWHYEMAMAAIEAGKHVYCEKPLALNMNEAQAMADAAAKRGVKTMCAFNNLKTPTALYAKQVVDKGSLGRLTRFRGRFDQGLMNDPQLPFSWRLEQAKAGSGSLGDLGSHALSVALFLMGGIEQVSAISRIFIEERPLATSGSGYAAKVGKNPVMKRVENDDQIQCLLAFANGASGVLEANRLAAGRMFGICWEVCGLCGTLEMDGERFNELNLFLMEDDIAQRGFRKLLVGSQVPQYAGFFGFEFGGGGLGYFDAKVIEIHDLIQGIYSPQGCFPDFQFGAKVQAVLEALQHSAQENGRWMKITQPRPG